MADVPIRTGLMVLIGAILILSILSACHSPFGSGNQDANGHKRDVIWLRQDTLAWSPNSRWLAVTLPDEVYIHDDQRRYHRGVRKGGGIQVLFATTTTSDTGIVLAANDWTAPRGILVYENRFAPSPRIRDFENPRSPVRLALSPDAEWLAGGANGDQLDYVYLWGLSTRQIAREMEPRVRAVSSLSFSADGQFLAVGRWYEAEVLVWDVTTGELACTLTGHTDAAHTVVFSPQENLLASGSDDHTVRLWDVTTCQLSYTLKGHSDWVSDVAFSPDGQVLASSGADGLISLWDPNTGVERHRLEEETRWVYDVEFSSDGQMLAAGGSSHSVFLWDVSSGQLKRRLDDSDMHGIYEVAWGPNGQVLVAAAMQGAPAGNVLLWDFTEDRWVLRRPGFYEK